MYRFALPGPSVDNVNKLITLYPFNECVLSYFLYHRRDIAKCISPGVFYASICFFLVFNVGWGFII